LNAPSQGDLYVYIVRECPQISFLPTISQFFSGPPFFRSAAMSDSNANYHLLSAYVTRDGPSDPRPFVTETRTVKHLLTTPVSYIFRVASIAISIVTIVGLLSRRQKRSEAVPAIVLLCISMLLNTVEILIALIRACFGVSLRLALRAENGSKDNERNLDALIHGGTDVLTGILGIAFMLVVVKTRPRYEPESRFYDILGFFVGYVTSQSLISLFC
jgi:hypothetical protein